MTISKSLQKTASKLMEKFGGALTYRRVSGGAYNASTGAITETVTDYNLRGVLQDVKAREVNELIQAGDKRLTIAAADVANAPTPADKVLIASVVHQIISVATTEQDNTAITYELILRA